MQTDVDIPRLLHTPAIVRVAWPTQVVALTEYTQPTLSNATTTLTPEMKCAMPSFVAADRNALRAGNPIDRPQQLRDLARQAIEKQKSGRPANIAAWADDLAAEAPKARD